MKVPLILLSAAVVAGAAALLSRPRKKTAYWNPIDSTNYTADWRWYRPDTLRNQVGRTALQYIWLLSEQAAFEREIGVDPLVAPLQTNREHGEGCRRGRHWNLRSHRRGDAAAPRSARFPIGHQGPTTRWRTPTDSRRSQRPVTGQHPMGRAQVPDALQNWAAGELIVLRLGIFRPHGGRPSLRMKHVLQRFSRGNLGL